MRMPGYSAMASLSRSGPVNRAESVQRAEDRPVSPQSRFGPTLPTCHWERQWVVCGSALPGYPTPMCLEWVYVCKFPGSSRGAR